MTTVRMFHARTGTYLDVKADVVIAAAVAERDRQIRALNRLGAAVQHHQDAGHFRDVHDDALYAARDAILKDLST